MRLLKSIKRDIQAALQHDPAANNAWQVVFVYPGFHARQWHRLAHTSWSWYVPMLPRLMSHIDRFFTEIESHARAKIGAGSVVTNSVPPQATVVGVPRRVVEIRHPDTDTAEKLPAPVCEKLQCLAREIAGLEERLADLESARFAEAARVVADPPAEEAKHEGI